MAAQKLSDSVGHYLNANAISQFQLWVYVFYNKRGLADTFGKAGLLTVKRNFDEFVLGFNQATERFLMVDVGGAKEAADAKVKGTVIYLISVHVLPSSQGSQCI